MSSSLKVRLREISQFNRLRRDAWVASQARLLPAGSRVLDAGAGTGKYREHFGHCHYLTQDFGSYSGTADGIMKQDWNYTKLDYTCDISNIPADSASFDGILCTEVLEHLPEPLLAIQEFSRLLKPGGTLLLTAPLGSGLHQEPYHFYGGYTPHWYEKFLAAHGFDIVSLENNGGFFLWQAQESFRLLGIVLEKKVYKRWDPRRELCRLFWGKLLPLWLANMEKRVSVPQFTVGYFVKARRRPTPAS